MEINTNSATVGSHAEGRVSNRLMLLYISIVLILYMCIELRIWYWGVSRPWGEGGELGLLVASSSLETYKTFKLVLLVQIVGIFTYVQAWRVLSGTVLIWVLFAWCFMSLIWAGNVSASLQQLILLSTTVAATAIFARLFTPEQQVRFITHVLALVLVSCLLFAIVNPSAGTMAGRHDGALRGLFPHKNHFGVFSVFAFTYFVASRRVLKEWLTNLALIALAVAGVYFSLSATAVGMLCVSIFMLIFFRFISTLNQRSRVQVFNIAIVLATLFSVLAITYYEPLLEMLGRDPTLTDRTLIWYAVLLHFQDNPSIFIFGQGASAAFADADLIKRMAEISRYRGVTSTHNAYFDIILNFGIVGLILFAIVLLKYIITSIKFMADCARVNAYWIAALNLQIFILFIIRNFSTSESGLTASFPFLFFMISVLSQIDLSRGYTR